MKGFNEIIQRRSWRAAVAGIGLAVLPAALMGCGAGTNSFVQHSAGPVAMAHMGGKVKGGQIPVSGAVIQLYAVGASGYGSAATPLFPPNSVVTDGDGNWSIDSYNCPSGDPQVYITSKGGNSGYGGNNPNLILMAALGDCLSTYNLNSLDITETTTVATVWAFAPFMTGPTNVGSSPNNVAGLVNAAADVNVLVDIGSGAVPGPDAPAGSTVSVQTINTVSNALAYCTNSTGGSAGDGTPCGNLFAVTTPASGAAPTEIVTAALNIAKSPAKNVTSILGYANQAPPSPPFQPSLTAAPNDYTVTVALTGGSMSAPSGLAIDASSNVWVANNGTNSVTELSHLGSVVNTTSGINTPSAIAVDQVGTVWVTQRNSNSVSRLSGTSGSLLPGSPITGSGLAGPNAITIDGIGNAWVTNNGGPSITQISGDGSQLHTYTPAGLTSPTAVGANPH